VTASASEVAKALDITIQRAGRYLKGLVSEGVVEIDHTQDHVPFYSSKSPVRPSNPEKRVTRDVTEAHAKDTEEVLEKIVETVFDPSTLIRQAEVANYNKGFSEGYKAGRKESYREAYEDGKRAVLDRLTRLLID
jgi:flagellar biosynthesis/type III secretory pathway protein FliH